ncbi:hypothetical protein CF319_g1359 [Tilletia indica]|nr:hypothetical protein CF319_g1359 [Tilletia indica]
MPSLSSNTPAQTKSVPAPSAAPSARRVAYKHLDVGVGPQVVESIFKAVSNRVLESGTADSTGKAKNGKTTVEKGKSDDGDKDALVRRAESKLRPVGDGDRAAGFKTKRKASRRGKGKKNKGKTDSAVEKGTSNARKAVTLRTTTTTTLPSNPTLLDLPTEIVLLICRNLEVGDLANLTQTSRYMRQILLEEGNFALLARDKMERRHWMDVAADPFVRLTTKESQIRFSKSLLQHCMQNRCQSCLFVSPFVLKRSNPPPPMRLCSPCRNLVQYHLVNEAEIRFLLHIGPNTLKKLRNVSKNFLDYRLVEGRQIATFEYVLGSVLDGLKEHLEDRHMRQLTKPWKGQKLAEGMRANPRRRLKIIAQTAASASKRRKPFGKIASMRLVRVKAHMRDRMLKKADIEEESGHGGRLGELVRLKEAVRDEIRKDRWWWDPFMLSGPWVDGPSASAAPARSLTFRPGTAPTPPAPTPAAPNVKTNAKAQSLKEGPKAQTQKATRTQPAGAEGAGSTTAVTTRKASEAAETPPARTTTTSERYIGLPLTGRSRTARRRLKAQLRQIEREAAQDAALQVFRTAVGQGKFQQPTSTHSRLPTSIPAPTSTSTSSTQSKKRKRVDDDGHGKTASVSTDVSSTKVAAELEVELLKVKMQLRADAMARKAVRAFKARAAAQAAARSISITPARYSGTTVAAENGSKEVTAPGGSAGTQTASGKDGTAAAALGRGQKRRLREISGAEAELSSRAKGKRRATDTGPSSSARREVGSSVAGYSSKTTTTTTPPKDPPAVRTSAASQAQASGSSTTATTTTASAATATGSAAGTKRKATEGPAAAEASRPKTFADIVAIWSERSKRQRTSNA